MVTIPPSKAQDSQFDGELSDFVPLTHEQARAFVVANPVVSPWWVVLGQVVVGVVISAVAWAVFGVDVAKSVACGSLAVVVPAALFARGLTSQFARINPGAAVISFFVWELVKIVVTLGMLYAAQRLVKDLSWPAMLVGLIVTIKVYWLALTFKRKAKPVQFIHGEHLPHGKSN
jgi:ATP synthase protein I